MVTGRIVDYDGLRGTYHLPPEHAASLTRAARGANLAGRAPRVAALAELEADLVELFRRGGGLSPASFARLREIEAGEIDDQESNLIAAIAAFWPDLVARLERGIDVLELRPTERAGSSSLAPRFPQSRCSVGAAVEGLDAQPIDLIITWEVFANHGDPAGLLRTIRSSLRPDGCLLCVEVAASSNLADNIDRACAPLLYATSTMQSLPLSLAAGGTAVGIMWGEESARRMLAETGFGTLQTTPFGRDPCRVCLLAKPLER